MNLKTTNDFKNIVINNTPLIDVRAPIEYEKGAFPNSINLPIMDNDERHNIGIKYKEEGNEEAVKLGLTLVSGTNKEAKVNAWLTFIEANPDTIVYCFRGGQRSRISQEWITEGLGREILRIEGGYKAFRNYLIDAFDPKNQNFTPLRLGGHTGSGKTQILNKIKHSIDLEGIANHRGSAFGDYITPQPTPIDFENQLAYSLIQQQETGYSHLVFEDEGKNIGRRFIPKIFTDHYMQSPLVVVSVSFEERSLNILKEYVTDSQKSHIDTYGKDNGLAIWFDYIVNSINKAEKRLGGDRHKLLLTKVKEAYHHQLATGSTDKNIEWIQIFLREYYDPMYEYQLNQHKKIITYEGTTDEVIDYFNDLVKVL